MGDAAREMTRDELVAEKAKLEEQCRVLANRCDMKENRIREMQSHIDCLKADLEEVQKKNKLCVKMTEHGIEFCQTKTNNPGLSSEPIDVASMLIKAKVKCKSNFFQKAFNENYSDEYEADRYSKEDLRQIAEYLLVYCNIAQVE